MMESENRENSIPDVDQSITSINKEAAQQKEEKLVNLIVEIIVSSTLKEYYEKSNKIP